MTYDVDEAVCAERDTFTDESDGDACGGDHGAFLRTDGSEEGCSNDVRGICIRAGVRDLIGVRCTDFVVFTAS